MIIICKECSTKFELDDSVLKGTGSQVRCSVCKNIFTAYPPHVLGNTETSPAPAVPVQQGYFDSEEELGSSGVGGFQKPAPDDDDDGLELDVEEDDEDMDDDDGLDLGDDDSGFDDGGIDLGNNLPGMNTGMNFDEDMDDAGMPGMDFDSTSENDTDELDLGTDININIDQGEEIELDAESNLKSDSEDLGIELPDLGPDPVADEDQGTDDESTEDESTDEDFEFEFELGEDDDFEVEEDLKLDNLSDEPEQIEETAEDFDTDEDFELSIYDENEDIDKETESPTLVDVEEDDIVDQKEMEDDDIELDSMELEIDNSDNDTNKEELAEDDFEEDDEYEIEEFGDDEDDEYEDDDIIDEEYEAGEDPEEKAKKPAKKSGKRLKLLLTILIFLCLGYGSFTLTDGFTKFDKINFSMVKNLLNFSSMEEVPVWATINNKSLNGRYVNNESSGKLFVISGKITNESTLPINNIEVEGTLIAKGGQVAKKKKVFCGNKIPEGQLSSLSVSNINKLLQRSNGEKNSNLNIQPNKSVPFMVVFSNLPNELENYTVTVASFKRMKK